MKNIKPGKIFSFLFYFAMFSIILTDYAQAYLDPSVMTYTVQVIAGIVVAVGAVVGIWWRKAKRKVQDKLGIDENAKKEKEADVVAFDDDDG